MNLPLAHQHPGFARLLKVFAFCIASTALGGCYRDAAQSGAAPAGSGTAASASDANATACVDASERVCKEAGAASETCNQARAVFGLISNDACALALQDFALTQRKLRELKAKCEELAEVLCNGVGPETESCAMVREKTLTFDAERCSSLLAERDAVIAELKGQEAMKQPLSSELQAQIAGPGAPSFGAADAKVTLVEFSDFQCPYCARAAEVTKQLRSRYGDKVRFVFRQFPLAFHQHAQAAAEAALAAHAQGKFWEFHDKLFENQSQLGSEALSDYAKQLGLDLKAFKSAVDQRTFSESVKADVKLGELTHVQGTPTLFINGKRVSDPTNLQVVAEAIDGELAN
jgi:protein-disulfide isomerase